MTGNDELYISKNIKAVYSRRLAAPSIYLMLLLLLWMLTSLSEFVFPKTLSSPSELAQVRKGGTSYVQAELTDLHFTGYRNTLRGNTQGYYYYTIQDGKCYIVLLSPSTSEAGLPRIEQVTIRARILNQGRAFLQITEHLASDLEWTSEGIRLATSPYLLSEPDFRGPIGTAILLIYLLSGIYALLVILSSAVIIRYPFLSLPGRQLGRFGNSAQLLAQAEEELATLPQLATEDMFITENFFIAISNMGVAVVPIKEILWIYKYSILHRFLWHHFHISYTLRIVANKHLTIRCPQSILSDIDGIVDYLAEANHDILVGFSEENRLKVTQMQGPLIGVDVVGLIRNKLGRGLKDS